MRNATPSHGDAERWVKGVVALPKTKVTRMDLKDSVTFGLAEDVEDGTKKFIVNILNSMMPWRKGRTQMPACQKLAFYVLARYSLPL